MEVERELKETPAYNGHLVLHVQKGVILKLERRSFQDTKEIHVGSQLTPEWADAKL